MKTNNWPDGADGDVFRKLHAKGFDFSLSYTIDFNIDFDSWPPSSEALKLIKNAFPDAKACEEDDGSGGYIFFRIKAPLTYELVINTQAQVTKLVINYGGRCESWGVMQQVNPTSQP